MWFGGNPRQDCEKCRGNIENKQPIKEKAMVKICKKPVIREQTDKLGVGLGTYFVDNVVGYVDDNLWEDLYRFERYYSLPECIMEQDLANQDLRNGKSLTNLSLPILNHLFERSRQQLFLQFNLRLNEIKIDYPGDGENIYSREGSVFGKASFSEWTPEHDANVAFLQKQVDAINADKA